LSNRLILKQPASLVEYEPEKTGTAANCICDYPGMGLLTLVTSACFKEILSENNTKLILDIDYKNTSIYTD